MLKSVFKVLYKSILDNFGRESHTRISSYIILLSIIITNLIYNFIDLKNAYVLWHSNNLNKIYVIPSEHVFILSLILSHHLILLGIKKNSEVKEMKFKTDSNNTNQQESKNPSENIQENIQENISENIQENIQENISEEEKK